MTYQRILLATDFSSDAREAAEVAASLRPPGGAMRVVHAIPPPMPVGTGLGIYPAGGALVYPSLIDTTAVRERLEDWVRQSGLRDAEPILVEGAPGASIAREAQTMNADLIVLGARGHSAIERVLLGTTAMSVLSHAHTDVLLVRNHRFAAGGAPFTRIAVATDFGASAILAAQRAHELADRLGAELLLLHVTDEGFLGDPEERRHPDEVAHRLQAFNEAHLGGRAALHLRTGPPARALRDMVGELGADLLVVGTHGGGILERMLMGSVARAVAEDAPCSVLVARREKPRAST